LTEEHWSYMDAFAGGMVARGPTFSADGATWTGSLHILDLPSADAAAQFVEREPYDRAGRFERHLLTPEDSTPAGVAFALHAPTREAVDSVVGTQSDVEIHNWELGGRR
jgi:uncharacterized protein YciI